MIIKIEGQERERKLLNQAQGTLLELLQKVSLTSEIYFANKVLLQQKLNTAMFSLLFSTSGFSQLGTFHYQWEPRTQTHREIDSYTTRQLVKKSELVSGSSRSYSGMSSITALVVAVMVVVIVVVVVMVTTRY